MTSVTTPVTVNDPEALVRVLRQEVSAAVSHAYETRNLLALCEELDKVHQAAATKPKWLRLFVRNQGRHNALIVEAVRALARQLDNQVNRHEQELIHLRNQIELLRRSSS